MQNGRTDVSRNGISGIYPKYEPLAGGQVQTIAGMYWAGRTPPKDGGRIWKSLKIIADMDQSFPGHEPVALWGCFIPSGELT